jgi:hypothetical protein
MARGPDEAPPGLASSLPLLRLYSIFGDNVNCHDSCDRPSLRANSGRRSARSGPPRGSPARRNPSHPRPNQPGIPHLPAGAVPVPRAAFVRGSGNRRIEKFAGRHPARPCSPRDRLLFSTNGIKSRLPFAKGIPGVKMAGAAGRRDENGAGARAPRGHRGGAGRRIHGESEEGGRGVAGPRGHSQPGSPTGSGSRSRRTTGSSCAPRSFARGPESRVGLHHRTGIPLSRLSEISGDLLRAGLIRESVVAPAGGSGARAAADAPGDRAAGARRGLRAV